MKRSNWAVLWGCTSLLAICAAGAASAADVRGLVVDAESGAILPGARVTLGGRTVTAGADGRFAFFDAQAGAIRVEYVGYATYSGAAALDGETRVSMTSGMVSELVVTGQRLAERRALQAKKVSNQIEDVLSANDVGKLPDQNVAEAVRRLPGVSVANDQGEGRYVIIRGVNPNLANVTINNLTAPAPEPEGRQVKLDDIPSSLIGRVRVIKSLTPDLDANAIAGQVDIDTLSAFDRSGNFVNARAAYGKFDLNGKHPYEADLTLGGKFGADQQFGAVLSANYSYRPIESENFGASGPTYGLVNSFLVPNLEEFRDYNLVRKRTGLVGNLDWRPTDDVSLFLRATYSKFSDNETRDRFRIDNPSAYAGQTATSGVFKGRGIAYVRRRQEDDNTKTLSAGGRFNLPVGELKVEGAWSRAEKVDPLRSEWQFRTSGTALNVTYDTSNVLYLFTPDATFFDPAKYTLNSVNFDHRKAVETLYQGRVDYTLPLEGFGEGSDLKLGVKYAHTAKTNERDFQQYSGTGFTLADTGPITTPDTIYEGRYALGPRVSYNNAVAYMTANPAKFTLNAAASLANNLVNDYDATEELWAGYAMADLHFGKWTVIPGVRVEAIKGDYKAKTVRATSTVNDLFNTFGSFDDTDVFPGLNLRYDLNRDLVLRAAVTTSIGRPNYADLAPFANIDTSGTGTVSLGNPKLEALKATNFDAAVEYYLPGQGILSVAVFRKQIDHPIFSAVRTPTSAEQALYGVGANAAVTQSINAQDAELSGIEFNAQAQLTFLPGPLDGFGLSGNWTAIDAHAKGVPARAGDVPLFQQSDQVGTIQVLYEKYGVTARLAWSWRSKYLLALGATAAADQWVDAYNSFDARIAYTIPNKTATVFLEGSNIDDEPYRIWVGNERQVIENERYGATWRAGVQLTF
jgi:TonB-dependent receptor